MNRKNAVLAAALALAPAFAAGQSIESWMPDTTAIRFSANTTNRGLHDDWHPDTFHGLVDTINGELRPENAGVLPAAFCSYFGVKTGGQPWNYLVKTVPFGGTARHFYVGMVGSDQV